MNHRRVVRTVMFSLAALLLAWALYRLFGGEPEPDLTAEDQGLLAALSVLVVVLALGLAGILVRNLARLIIDRKRGILGSRLRTKLVFFLLALTLLPAIVLFYGSAQVIKMTVEEVVRTPLEELSSQSQQIVAEWREYFENQCLQKARGISQEIGEVGIPVRPGSGPLRSLLERWQRQHELEFAEIRFAPSGRVGSSAADGDRELAGKIEEHVLDLLTEVRASGSPSGRINHVPSGLLAHAALPLGTRQQDRADGVDPSARPALPLDGPVVTVGMLLPTGLGGNLDDIAELERGYRQFRVQRRELVRFYLTLIGMIFLVTMLIATWIGFYLSRRITVPLQQLAAASREISAGNLQVRVDARVGDEMGMLVDAFNEMAGELEENREVITRSTAELRRSNRALDDRRRYIETLLANLSTGVISLDPVERVTTVNPAVRSILGLELSVGEHVRQALAGDGLEPLVQLLDVALESGIEAIHRDLSLHTEERSLQVAVQITPLRGRTGELFGTLIMVEDLTELMRAQRASAWREVARRIAHEIKNPLTPIQLSAQRLRKKFAAGASDLDRVVPEATASIEREVGALKNLVDEFSRFARMPEIAPEAVALPSVVESVLDLYKGHPDIRWKLELDPGLGEVMMDPQQMRRVLINLVDNAIAAMNGSGTITIRASETRGILRIELSDEGPGISSADKDKMFVPYFSTKKNGSGLGLAIVHKVVTDHRGTIRVEDNDPHGVRFVIEMPA